MRRFRRFTALLIALVLLSGLLPAGIALAEPDEGDAVTQMLEGMETQDKISQVLMPTMRWNTDENGERTDVTELTEDLSGLIEKYGFGGIILFNQNTHSNEQTVRLIDSMQQKNAKEGRPQLLIATDQEGGAVTRLDEGTQFPGNMALGAIDDTDVTQQAAALIGSELSALGIHLDFAPVADINNNAANPVIGTRSFSDDTDTVTEHVLAYMNGLKQAGVISALKHFPGHGDTVTDSHSDLPVITKTYSEIKKTELVPFQAGIDAGAEVVMLAHIQFPQIELRTMKTVDTDSDVTVPATMSKKIITDILRGDMGYDGVVITDSLAMGAIAKHFDLVDVITMAIDAGADMMLIPGDLSTAEGREAFEKLIEELVQRVEDEVISAEKLDAAVTRILKLKEKHGLLTQYNGEILDQRIANAASVGSKQTHDTEWNMTLQAITMLKNDRVSLPLNRENEKTVVLVPYDSETLSAEYALSLVQQEGSMPPGATGEVFSYQGRTLEEILEAIGDADNVIVCTEMYGSSFFTSDTAVMLKQLLAATHERGARFIQVSIYLPYDTALFPDADAVILAYGAGSMKEDPRKATGQIKEYGPNIPAAIYMMFSQQHVPSGHVPVMIPKLDETGSLTDQVLYPRWYGLVYPTITEGDPVVTVMTDLDKITTNGDVTLGIYAEDLAAWGFAEGDMVQLTFLEQNLVMPLCTQADDVDRGQLALVMDDDGVRAIVNGGDFASATGFAMMVDEHNRAFPEGVEGPVFVTVTRTESGTYSDQIALHRMSYSLLRTDYQQLTDQQFANFREVSTPGMGISRLYRTSSPVNPDYGRSAYADQALREAEVTVVLDLEDANASIHSFPGFADSYYSTTHYIGLNLSTDYNSEDFRTKLSQGLRYIADNYGVYALHCGDGMERTGFVCAILESLMGADLNAVKADFMASYENYYGLDASDDLYSLILEQKLQQPLEQAFGVESLDGVDLSVKAAEYLQGIGLSADDVEQLKTNLSSPAKNTERGKMFLMIAAACAGLLLIFSIVAVVTYNKKRKKNR